MQTKPTHPAAEMLPLMVGADFDALVVDIRNRGLLDAIILHQDGSILDGRNRYRACLRLKIEPRFEKWRGNPGDEAAFVVSVNVLRRHLDASQRAMVAAKIANLPSGQRQVGKFAGVPSQGEAAKLLNVSERTVRTAIQVRDEAPAETIKAVEQGEISVHAAAKQIKQSAPERRTKDGRRFPTVTPKREKFEAMQRERARYWASMNKALDELGNLPSPREVIEGCQAPQGRAAASPKIVRAIAWLTDMQGRLENVRNTDAA